MSDKDISSFLKVKVTNLVISDGADLDPLLLNWSNIYKSRLSRIIDSAENYLTANDSPRPSFLFESGDPWIIVIGPSFDKAIECFGNEETALKNISDMRRKRPESPARALLEAEFWIASAWKARGPGFADTVTEEGSKQFIERLSKAEKVLIESKAYASTIPYWYLLMTQVEGGLGRNFEKIHATFVEGAQKYRTYYPLYKTMVNYSSPKWGGNWDVVDDLISWSVNNTTDLEGNGMYSRLYTSLYCCRIAGNDPFKVGKYSWPKMKAGFEDLVKQYPTNYIFLNDFAKFSCLAKDKTTYIPLRTQMGNKIISASWRPFETETNPNGNNQEKVRVDQLKLCDQQMGYAKN